MLKSSVAIADEIRHEDVVVVMDQANLAKTKENYVGSPDRIYLNLLIMIGKRFGKAALADILVECGTVASGSVSGFPSSHNYN